MPQFLIDHLDGCTPIEQCASCRAWVLIKKMRPDDLNAFLQIAKEAAGKDLIAAQHVQMDMDKPWEEVLPRLSVRLANGLKNERVETMADVVNLTKAEILRIPNVARRSLDELEEALASKGLHLRPHRDV